MLPGIQIGIGIGVGVTGMNAGGSPTPPPVYDCGAVSLDGGAWLINAALASGADSGVVAFSGWYWVQHVDGQFPVLWTSDYAGDAPTTLSLDNSEIVTIYSGAPASAGSSYAYSEDPAAAGQWVSIIGGFNTNAADGSKQAQLLFNGVDVTDEVQDGANAFVQSFNGLPFGVGFDSYDDDQFIGYMADVWIAPGQTLLNESGVIPPETIAKFISAGGKPVDLGSDGSAPTGTAPAIFLHIDSGGNPMDFRTNKGTGGNFSLFGEATTTGALVSGSADVIVADTTGITAGVRVYAAGVTNGTTVLSIDTGLSTVTMSAQASTTNPTAAMQFGGVLQLAPSSPSD